MANISSDKAFFSIVDTGASVRTLSADIVSIEGLPGPRELLDSTTLGATGHTHHPTLENIRFTIEFLYNDTASTGSAAVINALRTHTAATAVRQGECRDRIYGNRRGFRWRCSRIQYNKRNAAGCAV